LKEWLPPQIRKFVAMLSDCVEKAVASCFSGIITVTYRIGQHFGSNRNDRNVVVVQNIPILDEIFDAESMVPWNERKNAGVFVGSIGVIPGIRGMIKAFQLIPDELNIQLLLAGYFSPESFKEEIQCMYGIDVNI